MKRFGQLHRSGEFDAVPFTAGVDQRSILGGPKTARRVEILERQAHGIHKAVATRAGGIGAMGLEAVSNSLELGIADVLEKREIDIGRRRRDDLAKNIQPEILAANRRRRPTRARL